jgi:hypothetical protein
VNIWHLSSRLVDFSCIDEERLELFSLLAFPPTGRVPWPLEGFKPGADFSFLEMCVQEGRHF